MTRLRFLAAAAAAAAAAVVGAVVLPSPAQADPPPVLTGPDSSWSTSATVADPHVQASCAPDGFEPLPVVEAGCLRFDIVLDGDPARPLHYLDVTLSMADVAGAGRTVEDYDLYLLDADGVEVASAASAVSTREVLGANHVPDGTYTILVQPYTNVPDSTFTLSARFRTFAE